MTSSLFMKSGNTFRVATKESMDLHDVLPVGNYAIKKDPYENFFFEHIEDFDLPPKFYGATVKQTDRIISTFQSRDKSTGVMLSGEKGSGKTLLSKNICAELAKAGVPTIVINQPWCGEKFNTLIQQVEQPAVILFDEFEKVYSREQQEMLLTLLDGVYSTKKLFILTTNDKWRIDSHMRNRPGRIFYMLDFTGLDIDFIREYCTDNLKDQTQIESLVNVSQVFSAFNFDMMKAMVEEMNRYGETPRQALAMLNVKAEYDGGSAYTVEIIHNSGRKFNMLSPSEWRGVPLSTSENMEFSFRYTTGRKKVSNMEQPKLSCLTTGAADTESSEKDEDDMFDGDWHSVELVPADLVKMDTKGGRFIFEKDGVTVILSRMATRQFNWDAF